MKIELLFSIFSLCRWTFRGWIVTKYITLSVRLRDRHPDASLTVHGGGAENYSAPCLIRGCVDLNLKALNYFSLNYKWILFQTLYSQSSTLSLGSRCLCWLAKISTLKTLSLNCYFGKEAIFFQSLKMIKAEFQKRSTADQLN